MWFQQRVVNPLMLLLLRSPLHAVAGRSTLLVTYTGRRSGRRVALPVAGAPDGADLVVLVGWPDRKHWWRNFTGPGGAPARVRSAGRWVDATGTVERGQGPALAAYLATHPRAGRGGAADGAVLVRFTPSG